MRTKKPAKPAASAAANVISFPARLTAEPTEEVSMDEAKRAEVVALFAEMKAAAAVRKRKLLRKQQHDSARGTQIINSTIIVCGDDVPSWLGELLAQRAPVSRKRGAE